MTPTTAHGEEEEEEEEVEKAGCYWMGGTQENIWLWVTVCDKCAADWIPNFMFNAVIA